MRRLFFAALFTLVGLSGCNQSAKKPPATPQPTVDRSQILFEGNQSLLQMKDAALRRDYATYFDSYEVLRKRYIELADELKSDKIAAEDMASFDTLLEWETIIKVARDVWREAGNERQELSSDLPQQLQDLLKESRDNWKLRSTEWAPIESRLDDAMKAMQELREQCENERRRLDQTKG